MPYTDNATIPYLRRLLPARLPRRLRKLVPAVPNVERRLDAVPLALAGMARVEEGPGDNGCAAPLGVMDMRVGSVAVVAAAGLVEAAPSSAMVVVVGGCQREREEGEVG